MGQFKIQKENQFLLSKLKNISSRPAKPQMNDMFIKSEAKKLQFNQKVKQFEIDSIQRENMELFRRMALLKSFINPKELDEEYKTDHQKMVSKIRKINKGTILLPSIYINNKSHSPSRSKESKTEGNVQQSQIDEEEENKEKVETAEN